MDWETLVTRLGMLLWACAWLGCAAVGGCRKSEAEPPGVLLQGSRNQQVRVAVEVVSRPEDKARGLMFRDHLGADEGMLFVYQSESQHPFWMKNTHIPLDMIFIGENRRIVGIVKNAEPMTTIRRKVEAPSRFVLEVNGGFVDAHGIRAGSLVQFNGIANLE